MKKGWSVKAKTTLIPPNDSGNLTSIEYQFVKRHSKYQTNI